MEKFVTLKKGKRARKHGFLAKMSNKDGRKTIKNRKDKHRIRVTL